MSDTGPQGRSTILVAVDGSDNSLRAAAYSAGMARRQHAKLVCLFVHVVSGMSAATVAASVVSMRESNAAVGQELRKLAEIHSAKLGIDIEVVEREGSPFTEIVHLADELKVDAIVIGASTQLSHKFVGSLGVRLVKAAHWPITVVP